MKALILTGGMGMRLRPLTLTTLKPLLPIANAPFLNYPLSSLRKASVKEVILCSSDSSAPYHRFIASQKSLGTKVLCSKETQKLGTGGAIKNAEKFLGGSSFFALNGDLLTDLNLSDMKKFHASRKAAVTISLIPVPDPSQFGLVKTGSKGEVLEFIEKPSDLDTNSGAQYLINGGAYIFEPEVLNLIPENRAVSIEREIFPELIRKGWPIYGYAAKPSVYWLDIGTPQKYLKGNLDAAMGKLSHVFPAKSTHRIGAGTKISPSASIGKESVLGKGCSVGKNSVLKNCVLLDRVVIKDEVLIENCVIGNHCVIGEHSRVTRAGVLGDRTKVTPFSQI